MIWILFCVLAVLQIADIWTTQKIFSQGGYEKNPRMKWVIDHAGFAGLTGVKAVVILAAGALTFVASWVMWWVLPIAILLMARIVWNNWKQIKVA